jgi:hypothetical protein
LFGWSAADLSWPATNESMSPTVVAANMITLTNDSGPMTQVQWLRSNVSGPMTQVQWLRSARLG